MGRERDSKTVKGREPTNQPKGTVHGVAKCPPTGWNTTVGLVDLDHWLTRIQCADNKTVEKRKVTFSQGESETEGDLELTRKER